MFGNIIACICLSTFIMFEDLKCISYKYKLTIKHTFSENLHCPYMPSCIICILYPHGLYSLLEFNKFLFCLYE